MEHLQIVNWWYGIEGAALHELDGLLVVRKQREQWRRTFLDDSFSGEARDRSLTHVNS